MLLMFGVGLHLSMGDLLSVRRIAVPGAVVQIAAATLLGALVATCGAGAPGNPSSSGCALSCASTVVLLRALEDRGVLETVNGRIAVGWLVVEDLAMVLVLVVLPAVAGLLGGKPVAGEAAEWGLLAALGITLAKIAAFVVLMLVVGRRVFPRLLWLVAKTGSRELFTLCVVATAVGVAYGSAKLFDVSFALGAFFAGMMMRESEFSHRAADESLPLREAFSVLFFVSVGMLFDPQVLLERAPEARSRSSRSSWWGRRSPPSRWCSPSATRSTRRSPWARASRRSASSPSSSRAWARASGSCLRRGTRSSSPARSSRSR